VACPRDGAIYVWDTSVGTSTRAAVISGAPASAKLVMVSPENRHLIAFGAHNGSYLDPLLIRWSTSEDYTDFVPDNSDSAGQKRLDSGNEILTAIKGRKEMQVFTDADLWAMAFIGPPNTFSFDRIGQNGGIRGPNAAIEVHGVTYWMGEKDFFYYDGSIKVLPCDVHPTVFGKAADGYSGSNLVQRNKTYAAFNRAFGEVWWLYCSEAETEVDRYVAFNVEEKTWTFGTLARTAFVGDSDIFLVPYATGTNGYIYDHETGDDDDTAAMTASLESGDVEIGEGGMLMIVTAIIPDFKRLTGNVSMRLQAKKYPHSSSYESDSGNLTVNSATKFVNPRVKGRQVTLSLSSSAVGDSWRMGTNRVGLKPYGKK